ncbi:hypothetical protein MMC13_001204 [Lambiella insularis]|nr:hypothetical protein [Lambiella insularis]
MDTFLSTAEWATVPMRPWKNDSSSTARVRTIAQPPESTMIYQTPPYFKYASIDYAQVSQPFVSRLKEIEEEEKSLVLANKKRVKDCPLLTCNISNLDALPAIESEADVVRESNAELIEWARTSLRELTGLRIKVRSEHPSDLMARPDMMMLYVSPGSSEVDSENLKLFTVIEFKNTKVIDLEGLKPAIFEEKRSLFGRILKKETDFENTANDQLHRTLIEGNNSLWLIKQVTKYFKTTGCPYHIVFDYVTMVGLNYVRDQEKAPTIAPKPAEIAWLTNESQNETDHYKFRSFLLGFLSNALKETLANEGIALQ